MDIAIHFGFLLRKTKKIWSVFHKAKHKDGTFLGVGSVSQKNLCFASVLTLVWMIVRSENWARKGIFVLAVKFTARGSLKVIYVTVVLWDASSIVLPFDILVVGKSYSCEFALNIPVNESGNVSSEPCISARDCNKIAKSQLITTYSFESSISS